MYFLVLSNSVSLFVTGNIYQNAAEIKLVSFTLEPEQLISPDYKVGDMSETSEGSNSEKDNKPLVNKRIKVSSQRADLGLYIPEGAGCWKFELIIEDKTVYQSGALYEGTSLPMVSVEPKQFQNGSYTGILTISQIDENGKCQSIENENVIVDWDTNTDGKPYLVNGGKG